MAVLALAAPAAAQEVDAARYAPVLDACLAATETPASCIGEATAACQTQEEDGHTTLGIMFCNAAETELWDDRLNVEYRKTMDWAKAADTTEGEDFAHLARREETLLAAQRAWIAFRDADCAFAYAQWGSGTMRNIAGSHCVMRMTAERAIELAAVREGM